MMQTIDNLKKQSIPKRGGAQKKGRAIENAKKKLEKQGLTRDEKGHRWTAQTAGTGRSIDAFWTHIMVTAFSSYASFAGIKSGSINSLDAAARGKMSYSEMLKCAELSIAPVPDKAVQFV
jgi:hypothetical protein